MDGSTFLVQFSCFLCWYRISFNAYNPEQLVNAFSAGKTVKTNYGKDYDKEFDEAGFCRVLAAALDSGRGDMDLFDATKLAKERSR